MMFLKIFFRSLFLQSLWNYERMQNVGFAFSMIPFIKKLYKDKIKQGERIKTHFGFFNTHPYLANLLIGITMKLEEQFAEGKISSDEIVRTKTMLSGPIAAIGDRFIWSTWRVFCGAVAVCYFLCAGKEYLWYTPSISTGMLIFLVLYNLPAHIPVRYFSIYYGYKYSSDVIQRMSKFVLQSVVTQMRYFGIIILLLSAFIYTISFTNIFFISLFWLNVLLSVVLSRKYAEVIVFYILFMLNILILLVFYFQL